ncbi:MAG: hypothetical protein Tsb0021_04950 [Chlamydiales bacterium]
MSKDDQFSIQLESIEEHRPWGYYQILARGQRYLAKKIVVYPQKQTSLQFHEHRDEHWVVVRGRALLTIHEETKECEENASVFIPKRMQHRIANPTTEDLEIIEVQFGDDLREDDITRISDDFGRV